ncbi:hypothetical protein [Rhizobium leguminosarum]|uniref:hypothetical protein n=1 Tax=Rhizobium leguminosarum TaxID=384 RepID=UPI001C96F298|nr:hypothetical protein [Rhizobium leguminosarum]MBY5406503.1 hypothetical protein [Rhizobium leguminosarum]
MSALTEIYGILMQNSAGNENRTGEAVKQTHGNISQSSKVLMMVAGGLLVVTSGLTYPEWLMRIIQFVIDYGHLYMWIAIPTGMALLLVTMETGDPKWSKWALLCFHCLLTLSIACGVLLIIGTLQKSIDATTSNELYDNQIWLALGFAGVTVAHLVAKWFYCRRSSNTQIANPARPQVGSSLPQGTRAAKRAPSRAKKGGRR